MWQRRLRAWHFVTQLMFMGRKTQVFVGFFFLSIMDVIVITPCLELRKFPLNLCKAKNGKEQIIKLTLI